MKANTREHYTVLGYKEFHFEESSPWFSGGCKLTICDSHKSTLLKYLLNSSTFFSSFALKRNGLASCAISFICFCLLSKTTTFGNKCKFFMKNLY